MSVRAVLMVIIIGIQAVSAAPRKQLEEKQARLHALKAQLARVQDSLETAIATRWNAKQQYVAAREQDKEELVMLREKQERMFMELSRVKEERFAWQRRIEEKRNQVQAHTDRRQITRSTLQELLSKEADDVMRAFPLDREQRRRRIEAIREGIASSFRIFPFVKQYVAYKTDYLRSAKDVTIGEATVMTDDGRPHTMQVARFGSVFAYGADSKQNMVMIRQTGRLDAARFSIAPVKQEGLSAALAERFPQWMEKDTVAGTIPTDILQNTESAQLVSGETLSGIDRFVAFVQSGGPVMFVLLILPLWALLLVGGKSIYFAIRFRRERRGMHTVEAAFVSQSSSATSGNAKSTIENMFAVCRAHPEWDRQAAEKALRGMMLEEFPRLSRHLSMLAVIAGVAPLLGLLGTVTGMINLFEVITTYGTGDPKIMAGGISEALITTQTGLAIAIPVLLCHSFLKSRKNNLTALLEKNAIEVLNHFRPGTGNADTQSDSSTKTAV